MNTDEIRHLLSRNPITQSQFRGVFALDHIPRHPQSGFYVINLDPSTKPGSHWVAAYLRKGKAQNIFFDSYGVAPRKRRIQQLVGDKFIFNNKCVQHPFSTTCGQWCIYFIFNSSLGITMKKMMKPFQKHLLLNDHVMNSKIEKWFKTKKKVINKTFLKNQIAKEMNINLHTRYYKCKKCSKCLCKVNTKDICKCT